MLRSTLPLGRYLGVELRLHLSFVLLLALLPPVAILSGASPARGIALWLAILAAVLTRELARALAAAYAGLELRAVVLLPVGGVLAFAPATAGTLAADPANTRRIAIVGPIANLCAALLLFGLTAAVAPRAQILALPLIAPACILRSLFWLQILLAVVSLLPAALLPLSRLFPSAQRNGASAPSTAGGEPVLVRDVMLTGFAVLSSSDTLRSALQQTVHSLHEVYPVLRGDQLVGTVARQTLANRLLTGGDTYLQGVMQRDLPLAAAAEPLDDVLRRSATLNRTSLATELIPVLDGDLLVGILTPHGIARALQRRKRLRLHTTA